MIIKLCIFIGLMIVSAFICYLISFYIGRKGYVKPGNAKAGRVVLLLTALFSIPAIMYLPSLPIPPSNDNAYIWLIIGVIALTGHSTMQGIENGKKAKKEKQVSAKDILLPA